MCVPYVGGFKKRWKRISDNWSRHPVNYKGHVLTDTGGILCAKEQRSYFCGILSDWWRCVLQAVYIGLDPTVGLVIFTMYNVKN